MASMPASQFTGIFGTEKSKSSGPAIACNTRAAPSADRHMGPILSSVVPAAITPCRLTRPKVGRRPTTPHCSDGPRMEPPVSVPMANPTKPAAVAAPDPAEDPLEPTSRFHGLLVLPPNQRSPKASSPVVSLATSTAPASSRRCTTVASSSITRSAKGAAPQVVG